MCFCDNLLFSHLRHGLLCSKDSNTLIASVKLKVVIKNMLSSRDFRCFISWRFSISCCLCYILHTFLMPRSVLSKAIFEWDALTKISHTTKYCMCSQSPKTWIVFLRTTAWLVFPMQQLKTFHWVNVLQWITGSFITVNTRYCGLSWANPKHTVLRLLRLLSEVFTQHLNIHHPLQQVKTL